MTSRRAPSLSEADVTVECCQRRYELPVELPVDRIADLLRWFVCGDRSPCSQNKDIATAQHHWQIMNLPKIQFGLRFLLLVMLSVALVGAALQAYDGYIPLAGAFPLSAGFACYIVVLIVGLCTSISRMRSAPLVYRLSAAGCAVILISHLANYAFQAVVYRMGWITQNRDRWLALYGWAAMIEQLLWAVGLTLFLRAIQQRADESEPAKEVTGEEVAT